MAKRKKKVSRKKKAKRAAPLAFSVPAAEIEASTYERRRCPRCDGAMPARQGWRPVPDAGNWRRRVRRCETKRCGFAEVFIELPQGDLEEYVRVHEIVASFRQVVTSMQMTGTPAPNLSRPLRKLLGLAS